MGSWQFITRSFLSDRTLTIIIWGQFDRRKQTRITISHSRQHDPQTPAGAPGHPTTEGTAETTSPCCRWSVRTSYGPDQHTCQLSNPAHSHTTGSWRPWPLARPRRSACAGRPGSSSGCNSSTRHLHAWHHGSWHHRPASDGHDRSRRHRSVRRSGPPVNALVLFRSKSATERTLAQ